MANWGTNVMSLNTHAIDSGTPAGAVSSTPQILKLDHLNSKENITEAQCIPQRLLANWLDSWQEAWLFALQQLATVEPLRVGLSSTATFAHLCFLISASTRSPSLSLARICRLHMRLSTWTPLPPGNSSSWISTVMWLPLPMTIRNLSGGLGTGEHGLVSMNDFSWGIMRGKCWGTD